MAATDVTIHLPDLMRQTMITANIRATGGRSLRVRIWIATKLITLAAIALGSGLSIDVVNRPEWLDWRR